MSEMRPLAERMRPRNIEEYIGQRQLVAPDAPIGRMLHQGIVTSMILWGPPGVGKTTLAEIIAASIKAPFYRLSATASGVADVRKTLADATEDARTLFAGTQRPILFIDEIHRFSKNQQDSLLSAIERGVVTLIGATTENPGFEVIRPLLSRCQVFVLEPLGNDDLLQLAQRALQKDSVLQSVEITLEETNLLLRAAGGDARKLLNLLELIVLSAKEHPIRITDALVEQVASKQPIAIDKLGDMHYDIASAMIKSIRGSDPDAALYWMARLIEGGETPRFIARRIVISAAEDIGLANPQALVVAQAAADAVEFVGWPEGRIPLAEAIVYLAGSPKSNSAYLAIDKALAYVRRTGNLAVPIHLRNAVNSVVEKLNYGKEYLYPHDYPRHYTEQDYLPEEAKGICFYTPQEVGAPERNIAEWLRFARYGDKDEEKGTEQ